ncbi:MAG: segregation/condensation protein A [Gammaproteobacteria bacterium]|nr:segregation/condensation protein A [Gammaproteobacteria bacterium]
MEITEENTAAQGQQQAEMPFALVQGEAYTKLPKDLYIPPDALEVFLDTFEGPLDLLLYLIKRQNLDVLNIPLAEITRQYMDYVDLMKDLHLELAAEYLVMAAMLAEIKSRMLLPRAETVEDEDDPRAELVRRLQEYERYKQAAEDIDAMPRLGRDVFTAQAWAGEIDVPRPEPELELKEILLALADVFKRADMYTHHNIQREALSVRERMSTVLAALDSESYTDFISLFPCEEGRHGVVVTLLAVLELVKETLIELIQAEPYGSIHVKAVASSMDTTSSDLEYVSDTDSEQSQEDLF